MADANITADTELVATKQALIASLVQKELAAQSMFLPYVTDVSMFAVKGAKSIAFPKAGSLTAANRASGVAGVPQKLTFASDTLLLNFNAYVAWLIDSTDAYQSNIAVAQEYIKRAASAHARYLDSNIITEFEAIAFNTPDTTDLTDAIILDMRMQLIKKNADRSNMFMAVAPDQEAVMLAIDKFVRFDALGNSKIPDGAIGRIYGMPCFVSNNLKTGQCLVWDKASLAVGFQKAPNYASQPKIEYGTTAQLEVVDQLYGIKGMQLGQESVAADKSPLVCKLIA